MNIHFLTMKSLKLLVRHLSNFSLGIQKYVYLAVLQTTVFPLKPQKDVYFFLGHPVSGKLFIIFVRMSRSSTLSSTVSISDRLVFGLLTGEMEGTPPSRSGMLLSRGSYTLWLSPPCSSWSGRGVGRSGRSPSTWSSELFSPFFIIHHQIRTLT